MTPAHAAAQQNFSSRFVSSHDAVIKPPFTKGWNFQEAGELSGGLGIKDLKKMNMSLFVQMVVEIRT